MIAPRKLLRNIAAHYGAESAAFGKNAHIHMDHEEADSEQSDRSVDEHSDEAEESEADLHSRLGE